jgi:hypothetical protein
MRSLINYSIITGVLLLFGCSRFVNREYVLQKKYPTDVPPMNVKFLTDSTGLITNEKDNSTQRFSFTYRKHFMVIISTVESNFVSLQKGDTIVYHKDKLYLFDKSQKLIFAKKNQ